MNILVLNGSPKGDSSITLQTVRYIEKKHPEHVFRVLHVGQRIKAIEKDFSEAEQELRWADLLLFSYPVYTFIAPSQLHRFIELMKKSGIDFCKTYATQITTSKHFYDLTAHNFVMENMQDMRMKFIKGLSADMDDLLTDKGQEDAQRFFDYVNWCTSNDIYETIPAMQDPFVPKEVHTLKDVREKTGDVVIVTDLTQDDTYLAAMIARFQAACEYKTRIINIHEFPFRGGCLSCFHCASSGKCVYSDGFDRFLRENIQTAQAIIIAFTIRDHSMGSTFKMYDDRQFCNGHRTVTMGMPFGYLINGPYSLEQNLRLIIEGRAEVGGNYLVHVATNEFNPDDEIDKLAQKLSYAVANQYVQPSNFLGVGGMKIFRDLIWLMKGIMKEDHRFFKTHGQYDFPQKKRGTRIKMQLAGILMSNESLMKKAGNKVNEGMIGPYRKVVEKAEN